MGIVSTNRKFFEELNRSSCSSSTGPLQMKNREQWQWKHRWVQHREDNNIPITNHTNDEMVEENEEEIMTNDEMIDSLISLLNYWSYTNTQHCTNDEEEGIITILPLQKYDVRDEDEEVTIYNEMIDALLLYLEEPIPGIISSLSRISDEEEDHYGCRKQDSCYFTTSSSPYCHQKAGAQAVLMNIYRN